MFSDLRLGFYAGGTWETLLATVVNWILIIAAVVAFFYLIWSGFTYLTAGGNPDAAKKGQQGIINAVIGIIIIFLAFAITRAVVNFTGDTVTSCPRGQICNPTTNTCWNGTNNTGTVCTP